MGPLSGLRIIEVTGPGPGPFCGMMLADMGAEVIRVERSSALPDSPVPKDPLVRSRKSIALDLKNPRGLEILLRLATSLTPCSRASGRALRNAWASARTSACNAMPGWSMGVSPVGDRTGHWPTLPATTSITLPFPVHCTPSALPVVNRCHH